MLKKKIMALALCTAMLFSSVSVFAAVKGTLLTSFKKNETVSESWNNSEESTKGIVETDKVPSGYAVTNADGKGIWLSSKSTVTINPVKDENDFYMSYYLNLGELKTSDTLNYGVSLWNEEKAVLRTGITNGKITIDKGSSNTARTVNAELTAGHTYQVVVRMFQGSNYAADAYVYDAETGEFLAKTTASLNLGTALGGEYTVKVGWTGYAAAESTQFVSDLRILECSKTDALAVFTTVGPKDEIGTDLASIAPEIGEDVDKIDMPESRVFSVTNYGDVNVTYTSSNTDIIADDGTITHPDTDTVVYIKANLAHNTTPAITMERVKKVVVKAKTVAEEVTYTPEVDVVKTFSGEGYTGEATALTATFSVGDGESFNTLNINDKDYTLKTTFTGAGEAVYGIVVDKIIEATDLEIVAKMVSIE